MKKLLLLVLFTTLIYAQSYKEFAAKYKYETNYEKALQRAKVEKKDVLLLLVTNYCPWCRKFEKKVLAKDVVNSEIHKNYIPLIVNREEHTLAKRFDSPIVPVTYIVSYKDDTQIKSIPGYQGKLDFLHSIKKK